ncbi:MAG: hypothetical protein ACFFCW_34550 [Candidatus Hodarchaeota archaeon]
MVSKLFKTNRFTRLDILILAVTAVIGIVNIPIPFMGDQALFTIGASKISHGAILYRDFWDAKQPGIYLFYLVAGTIFGFSEVGVHTFEIIYMVIFSVLLTLLLKKYYKDHLVASLVPLLTVGIYYGSCHPWHLTQLEALVGLPMFLSLWLAFSSSQSGGNRGLRLFISGLMGGIVLLFKLMFLPILAAFWLTCFIDIIVRKQEKLRAALIRIGGPIMSGVLSPLLIALAYFAWHKALNILYLTSFEYPVRMVNEISYPGKIQTLIQGLQFFIYNFAPLMALGFIGAYTSLNRRIDLLTLNLVLWVVLGLGVILLQRLSWWEYHYFLLFVPLGILGAKGLDFLWRNLKTIGPLITSRRGSTIVAISLALLFTPVFGALGIKALYLTTHGFALKREQRLKFQAKINDTFRALLAEVKFLSEENYLSGDIYVFGDPLVYFLSGRGQAVPIHGWAAEFFLPEQWIQLKEQLAEALPPYIFVATSYLDLVLKRSPGQLIQEKYRVLHKSDVGVWYVLI